MFYLSAVLWHHSLVMTPPLRSRMAYRSLHAAEL
jgi:hypothetical protein